MRQVTFFLFLPFFLISQDTALVGDVDCDGQITSEDASLILQYVTNTIEVLPCEDNMTGLTPDQLQEIINMMNDQLSMNYGTGSDYPIMISTISLEAVNFGDAMIYCDNLIENGYSDWFLPNSDQLSYAVSGGCDLPDERTSAFLWTTTIHHYYSSLIVNVTESGSSGVQASYGDGTHQCRCVRFGSQQVGVNSANSSSSLLVGSGVTQQPITMIGPMYINTEFSEFSETVLYPDNETALHYFEAIRFCAQLVYEGYDDWYVPSYKSLFDYLTTNNVLSIPNQTSNFNFYLSDFDARFAENATVFIDVNYGLLNYTDIASYYTNPCFCVR